MTPDKKKTTKESSTMSFQDDTAPIEMPEPAADSAPHLLRPPMSNRQYSTHIYQLSTSQSEADTTEAREAAHSGRRRASSVATERIVTVVPSRSQVECPAMPERQMTSVSVASSGVDIEEVEPSAQMLELVEPRGPGTFRVQEMMEDQSSTPSTSADPENPTIIETKVERICAHDENFMSKDSMQDLLARQPLPSPKHPGLFNRSRHIAFSTYRRLFATVLLANLVALGFMISNAVFYHKARKSYCNIPGYCETQQPPDFVHEFTADQAAAAVAANVLATIAMRNEHVINSFWRLCLLVPRSWPLGIRRRVAKVYSYGGIHSACGISAMLWYFFFSYKVISRFDPGNDAVLYSLITLIALTNLFFVLITCMSWPSFRSKYHDAWELSHRYLGWSAVLLIWGQVILLGVADAKNKQTDVGSILARMPAFWLLVIITCLIIYPWLHLRRVKFTAEKLSNHAVRLVFHEQVIMKACVGISLSRSPFVENHKFATIPEPDGQPGYSVIISKAGDWTAEMIQNPPKYLWTRGVPTIGVMRLSLLFRKIVIVATGSGIGPCLSFLNVYPEWNCRIVWTGRSPCLSLGEGLVNSVVEIDKDAHLVDTLHCGKPDLLALSYAVYRDFGAEAVVIISNPSATKKVVYGLEKRGVPAFGAIFDS